MSRGRGSGLFFERLSGTGVRVDLAECGHDNLTKDVQALPRHGGQVEGEIGEILHFGECLVDGVLVSHTWVRTRHGNAALILMPVRSDENQQSYTVKGYSSMVLPMGHS